VFEQANTVHTLDCAATVISKLHNYLDKIIKEEEEEEDDDETYLYISLLSSCVSIL
jgi:hypothetical protein